MLKITDFVLDTKTSIKWSSKILVEQFLQF